MNARSLLKPLLLALPLWGATATQADVLYSDFTSLAGLSLQGSAAQAGSALRLTPSLPGLAGSAWTTAKVGIAGGFISQFDFRISDLVNTGSDGFAFVVQNSSATALGSGGGGIGFAGIANSLAVKFDTHQNGLEPGQPSVGFQPLGQESGLFSLGATAAVPNFKDAQTHHARVAYLLGTLSLFIDDMNTALLVRSLDLSSLLTLDQGQAWVGFTAGTGGGYENHDILNWRLQSVPEPAGLALCLVAGLAWRGAARLKPQPRRTA